MVNLRGYESNLSSIKAPSWRDIFFTIAFMVEGHIYGMHGWLGTQIPGGNWHPLDEYDFTPHYPNDLELESRTAISASFAVLLMCFAATPTAIWLFSEEDFVRSHHWNEISFSPS